MRKLAAILFLATISVLHAEGNAGVYSSSLVSPMSPQSKGLNEIGATYQMLKTVEVRPLGFETEEGSVANTEGKVVVLEQKDAFVLMAKVADQNGRTMVRLGTDFEDVSDFWVYADDIPEESVKLYVEELDPEFSYSMLDDKDALNQAEESYIQADEARRGHGWSHLKRRAHGGGSFCTTHPRAKGCCFSAVKGALLAMGLVNHRLAGVNARSAASQLTSGWREVGCASRNSPRKGMTCTYSGGAHGHVEVYNGSCWYYGAKCGHYMTSPARHCFSCKVKVGH